MLKSQKIFSPAINYLRWLPFPCHACQISFEENFFLKKISFSIRYACTVCSHVSRSKDALRKHISYRHPGTPSPCESENRRKRTKLASQIQQIQAQQMIKDQIAAGNLLFSAGTPSPGASGTPMNMDTNASQLALLQSFTSEMTIPSQTQAQLYHHHQQQQQQPPPQSQQQPMQLSHPIIKSEINNNSDEQAAGGSQ